MKIIPLFTQAIGGEDYHIHVKGSKYLLTGPDGDVGKPTASFDQALDRVQAEVRRKDAETRRERPCMSCQKPFAQKHKLNRLCEPCGRKSEFLGV